jgi:hypothetical protein
MLKLKRLAILTATLAALGANVALAEPTLELGGSNASAPVRAESTAPARADRTAPPSTAEQTAPSGSIEEGTAPARTSVLPHTVAPESYNWNA